MGQFLAIAECSVYEDRQPGRHKTNAEPFRPNNCQPGDIFMPLSVLRCNILTLISNSFSL